MVKAFSHAPAATLLSTMRPPHQFLGYASNDYPASRNHEGLLVEVAWGFLKVSAGRVDGLPLLKFYHEKSQLFLQTVIEITMLRSGIHTHKCSESGLARSEATPL